MATLVFAAPNAPGVYELWNDDEVVYVGSTRDERHTLREMLVHDLIDIEREATHFSFEITFHPGARERELMDEFVAAHHHRPRLNARG